MADQLTIRTNNQPRPIVYGFELSEKERKDFDYYEAEELEGAAFFRYKGQVYDLGEFMSIDSKREPCLNQFSGWHGYRSDSYFSGLLVKYTDDCDSVIVASYH